MAEPPPRPSVVVVGAGISGLAAAWELSGPEPDGTPSPLQVTVLEASTPGGKLRTTELAGVALDEGADAFLRRVPDALELCEEMGLSDGLVSPARGNARVWNGHRLVDLPTGTVMGLPVSFDGLAAVLSPEGVARAREEPTLPGGPLTADESLGSLVRRRYGDEVLERLVAPLIGGINAGDADRLSVDAALPQIAAAARRSTSLSRALASDLDRTSPNGPIFSATTGGMGALIGALVDTAVRRGVTVLAGRPVTALRASSARWSVDTPNGTIVADAVIVATPVPAALRLVGGACPQATTGLAGIDHSSVVLVSLAHRVTDVPDPLDASGFLVPRVQRDGDPLRITAASWSSAKWAHLAGHVGGPGGDELTFLRVSLGHRDDPDAIELDDADVLAVVARDLATTMGITAAPVASRISRWRDGFPQYDVGHLDLVAGITAAVREVDPPLALTGSAYEGVGIPACIRHGRATARAMRSRLVGLTT